MTFEQHKSPFAGDDLLPLTTDPRPAAAGFQAAVTWRLERPCLGGGTPQAWKDLPVEEFIVQRQVEAIDPEFVELPHSAQDRFGTADEAAGKPFVGVKLG